MNTRSGLIVVLFCLVAGSVGSVGPARAQTGVVTDAPDATVPLKQPAVAALLQVIFPYFPIGFWYAGDTLRGIPPVALIWAGSIMWNKGFVDNWEGDESSEFEGALVVGMLAGGWLWGVLGAADTARDTNARLELPESSLQITPMRDGMAVTFTASF